MQDPESSKEGETALKKTRWTKRENLLAKAVLLRSRYEKMGVDGSAIESSCGLCGVSRSPKKHR